MGDISKHMKSCAICGALFLVPTCLIGKRKYCSQHCLGVANGLRFREQRKIRMELIEAGVDLKPTRRNTRRKFDPDDELPDPDEPSLKQQQEINKQIEELKGLHNYARETGPEAIPGDPR